MTRTLACVMGAAVLLTLADGRSPLYGAPQAEVAGSAAFDVASIKRVPADTPGPRDIQMHPGGRFIAPASTVRGLAAIAYSVPHIQIVGGPSWIDEDLFEVLATTRAGVSADDARGMLRTLLADRFRFSAHRETRELPIHVMTMARADRSFGPQLRPSGAKCAPMKGPARGIGAPAFVEAPPPPPPPPPEGTGAADVLGSAPRRCPSMAARMNGGGHWSFREETMDNLAQQLAGELGRPVINRTELEGVFDFDLTFVSGVAVAAGTALDAATLIPAMRDQLGLRLESSRAPVDVLVIDRVEPPTEN